MPITWRSPGVRTDIIAVTSGAKLAMGSTIVILDRLLDQAGTSESKEHVLEQASYAVDNVQQRLLGNFEGLVEEITTELGKPEFNASTVATGEEKANPMPSWVVGAKANDASKKILRLSYWKRDSGISYVILRMEVDSKDRPKYYDLVLGARRRTKSDTGAITKMRSTDTSFLGWVKRMFAGKKSS
jgi:hypothetical protein